MLVCNVSLRPPRASIAVTIAEATAAVDALAIGNVVFTTLVDDPASVGDIVDAYLGEFLIEAASASDTVDFGGSTVAAVVDEAGTAASAEDATVGGAVVARSAMIAGRSPVFVNPGTSREANVIGTQVNQ